MTAYCAVYCGQLVKGGPAALAALLPLYSLVTLCVWKFCYCLQKCLEFDARLMSWLLCSWTFFSLTCLVWCHCSHCSSTWLILGCHILHLFVFSPAFIFKVGRKVVFDFLIHADSLLRKDRLRCLLLFSSYGIVIVKSSYRPTVCVGATWALSGWQLGESSPRSRLPCPRSRLSCCVFSLVLQGWFYGVCVTVAQPGLQPGFC